MSYRFDFGLVPAPVSHMRVACASCGDYPDDTSGESGGDNQGLPALRPNVAIIIIGLGFTLVVVAAFAVFAKFMRPHMNRQSASAGTSGLWEDVVKDGNPVDAKVIKSLPLVVYSAESFQGLNLDLECAVCLSQFEEGEEVRLLPSCKHMFHPDCIDGWLRSHPFCPLCRSSVLSVSWAAHSAPDRSALGAFEASIPERSQGGSSRSRADQQQLPPSLEPHVEIPVLESFEARFEALQDNSHARKSVRSSSAAELVSQEVHNSKLPTDDGFDLQGMASTSQQGYIGSHRLCKPEDCDIPINAVCISILPEVKNSDADSCRAPQKREWAPRLCGDRVFEGSSSKAPSSSKDTFQHR